MQPSVERKWMIKSENKVLGPYSFDEIEDLLKKKQISLIDEVRDMSTRWMYIREAEPLQAIVEEVRKQLANTDDHTKTFQTRTSQGSALSQTTTKDILVPLPPDEKTDTTTAPPASFTNVSVEAQDVGFTDVVPTIVKEKTQNKIKPVQHYVLEADPNVQNTLKESFFKTIGVLIVVLMSVLATGAGVYFYTIQNQKKQEQAVLTSIRKYAIYNLDTKVIELYGNLSPELQKQILPDIISLIPKLDAVGFISGAQVIAHLKSNPNINDQKKALLEIIDFNQSLQDQNIKKARESLIRAKDLDPTSEVLQENEAIINYYEGNFTKAGDLFYALCKSYLRGRTLFGFVASHLASGALTSETEESISKEIDRYTATRVDFKKELLLMSMYLSKKNNKEIDFKSNLSQFLAMPVALRKQFQIPYLVFSDFYSMYTIRSILEKLKPFLNANQKLLVETHVKLELGEIAAAQTMFTNYRNSIEKVEDKINLQMQIDFALKNNSAVLAQEKAIDVTQLNAANHLSLLMIKSKMGLPESDLALHANFLKPEKNALALWAELLTISDSRRKVVFVQMNSSLIEDFVPFQEIKGEIDK